MIKNCKISRNTNPNNTEYAQKQYHSTFKKNPIVLLLLFFINPQNLYAQYPLPKPEVLVKNQVRLIHVSKASLRMVDRDQKEVANEKINRTPIRLSTYFISAKGQIDSIHNYHGSDTTKYNTQIFRYDAANHLVETTNTKFNGVVEARSLVEKTANGEWQYCGWNHEVLTFKVKSTADSIVYQSMWFQAFTPKKYYTVTTFNLQHDIKTVVGYEDDMVLHEKSYQWITDSGIPYRFVYTQYVLGRGEENTISETTEFDVAEDGTVINELNGLFTDPFLSFNYFKRHERFKGISNPHKHLLIADTLITQKEVSQLLRFDGTEMVYMYEMEYK